MARRRSGHRTAFGGLKTHTILAAALVIGSLPELDMEASGARCGEALRGSESGDDTYETIRSG